MPNRIIKVTVTPKNNTPTEPVDLATVKEWCIVGHSDDDILLSNLVTQVRQQAEAFTKNCFVDSSVELIIDVCKKFKLPRSPLINITKVEIRNTDKTYEELTVDDYDIIGEEFRSNRTGIHRITYDCGYSTAGVPQTVKKAILTETAFSYENRGDSDEIRIDISPSFERYLQPYINLAWQ